MRSLLEARDRGHTGAKEAIDVFCHRLARAVGGLATALPSFDALVFTGGIGEHAPAIRAETLSRLTVFGFELNPTANADPRRARDGRITTSSSRPAFVIPTNEERRIAMETSEVVAREPTHG